MEKIKGLKIVLAEDDALTARRLEVILRTNGHTLIHHFISGEDLLEKMSELNGDVILMDVGLRGDMNGIEVSKVIRKKSNVPIIYVTSHDDMSIWKEALETYPSAYLLKPVNENELLIAIELAHLNSNTEETEQLENNNNNFQFEDRIFIRDDHSYKQISTSSILYLKADRSYTEIYCEDRKYVLSESLNHFQKKLNLKEFMRIHRSWIVNLNKIEEIEENRLVINKVHIPLGKTYKASFKKYFRFI